MAEQDAERECMAVAYTEQVRALGLTGDAAAEACRGWAYASGLDPAPADVVRAALETHELLVEDTFRGLPARWAPRGCPRPRPEDS